MRKTRIRFYWPGCSIMVRLTKHGWTVQYASPRTTIVSGSRQRQWQDAVLVVTTDRLLAHLWN